MIKHYLRARIACTSRRRADAAVRREGDLALALLDGLTDEQAAQSVRVPRMIGVDEDMRDWSLHQTLEHNTIVNRIFSMIVLHLARGKTPPTGDIDPKKDVMPTAAPGPPAVDAFRKSIDRHLELVAGIDKLRGTARYPHPILGPLDAHGFHTFFSIHLAVHRRQMVAIRAALAG